MSLACRATGARPPAKIRWFRNNVAFNLPEGGDDCWLWRSLCWLKAHQKAQWFENNVAFNLLDGGWIGNYDEWMFNIYSNSIFINEFYKIIPYICQFWYTATLSRPVKGAPKRAWIRDIEAIKKLKIGKKFASSLAVVTNISYASMFHLTDGISYF